MMSSCIAQYNTFVNRCCVLPGDLALLYESWWKTRRSVVYTMSPDRREESKTVLFDRWVQVCMAPSAQE
jgi:hypothetical protein